MRKTYSVIEEFLELTRAIAFELIVEDWCSLTRHFLATLESMVKCLRRKDVYSTAKHSSALSPKRMRRKEETKKMSSESKGKNSWVCVCLLWDLMRMRRARVTRLLISPQL